MKILQVSSHYFPLVGGVQVHVRNISERLARKHDVTVFTSDRTGKLPQEEDINGVLVRRFKCYGRNKVDGVSFGMLRELRRSEFDVVHGHNYHALSLLFSTYAWKRKFVVTPHYHRHGMTPLIDMLVKLLDY